MLGKFIKQRRIELNLTLKEVANKVGVAEATAQRWESGVIKTIRADKLNKLSAVLNVPISTLTSLADKTPTEETLKEWEQKYNSNGKLAKEVNLIDEITKQNGQQTAEGYKLFIKLDDTDQGKVVERMETMLEADKYQDKEGLSEKRAT